MARRDSREPGQALPEAAISAFADFEPQIDPSPEDEDTSASHSTDDRLRVKVAHGNLAFASNPVVLGHYDGDLIVSAEGALDHHLDGRLSDRHASGDYPGPLDTAAVVFNSVPNHTPRGGLIVGLGRAGELDPAKLKATMTRGAIAYINACREGGDGEAEKKDCLLGLSPLLIGTGEGGISLREALRAVLDGILAANRAVAKIRSHQTHSLRLCWLEFIELYEDQANAAIQVLRELTENDPRIELDPCLVERKGGLRRIVREPEQAWWLRLKITRPERRESEKGADFSELSYLGLTDRARVPRYLQRSQVAVVESMVRSAIGHTSWDASLSRALFELLIPADLKPSVSRGRSLELVVDEHAAAYPWELLMDPRGGHEPFSVKHGIVRRLIQDAERLPDADESRADVALVIGNPRVDDPRFADLPGATREAVAVAQFLQDRAQSGFEVLTAINATQQTILKRMLGDPKAARGFRILHLAGHGIHEPGGKSGLVIGPDTVIGPDEVAALPRVPEFVFLNCCHLGRMDGGERRLQERDAHRLAANLGIAFIRRGARGVVAAGWAVNDGAAELFAKELYTRLLKNGEYFGDAVTQARKEVFDKFRDTGTWGAYQCYGDHSFRLRRGKRSESEKKPAPRRWYSPRRAVQDFHNIAQEAETTQGERLSLLTKLREMETDLGTQQSSWYASNASLRSALGMAYGQLGEFDSAVNHFEVAFAGHEANFPARHLEIAANLRARRAMAAWRKVYDEDPTRVGPRSAATRRARAEIERSLDEIDRLSQWGKTPERHSLRGSAFKRLAAIQSARPVRIRYLQDAYESYHDAVKIVDEMDVADANRNYHVYNLLFAHFLLTLLDGTQAPDPAIDFGKTLDRAIDHAKTIESRERSFFSKVALTELQALQVLKRGRSLSRVTEESMDGYTAAWHRGGSVRSLGSILEHLFCARRVLASEAGRSGSKVRREVIETIQDLEHRLAELPGKTESAKSDTKEGS